MNLRHNEAYLLCNDRVEEWPMHQMPAVRFLLRRIRKSLHLHPWHGDRIARNFSGFNVCTADSRTIQAAQKQVHAIRRQFPSNPNSAHVQQQPLQFQ
eukprot:1888754-Amphidinium_carterae.1